MQRVFCSFVQFSALVDVNLKAERCFKNNIVKIQAKSHVNVWNQSVIQNGVLRIVHNRGVAVRVVSFCRRLLSPAKKFLRIAYVNAKNARTEHQVDIAPRINKIPALYVSKKIIINIGKTVAGVHAHAAVVWGAVGNV